MYFKLYWSTVVARLASQLCKNTYTLTKFLAIEEASSVGLHVVHRRMVPG
jgi:hypothetical protein